MWRILQYNENNLYLTALFWVFYNKKRLKDSLKKHMQINMTLQFDLFYVLHIVS